MTQIIREWEPLLLDAGYEWALFNGLNRYYVRADEPQLLSRLDHAACVLDDDTPLSRATERAEALAHLERLCRATRAFASAYGLDGTPAQ